MKVREIYHERKHIEDNGTAKVALVVIPQIVFETGVTYLAVFDHVVWVKCGYEGGYDKHITTRNVVEANSEAEAIRQVISAFDGFVNSLSEPA